MSPRAHLAKLSAKRSCGAAQAPSLPSSQPQPARDAGVERRREVVGHEREVDDVAELVEHRALHAAGPEALHDQTEVDGHDVARAPGVRGEPDGAGRARRAEAHEDQPVDQVDQPPRLGARPGHGGEERLPVAGAVPGAKRKVGAPLGCREQLRAAALRARRVQAVAGAGDVRRRGRARLGADRASDGRQRGQRQESRAGEGGCEARGASGLRSVADAARLSAGAPRSADLQPRGARP